MAPNATSAEHTCGEGSHMVRSDMMGKDGTAATGRAGAALLRWFAAVGLAFGILFVFITPPFQVPDEPVHFYRTYQIAQGRLFAERRDGSAGGVLPVSLVDVVEALSGDIPFHPENKADPVAIRNALPVPLDPTRTAFVSFPNTAIYSFIPYLPQALAVWAGRQFELSPLWLLYIGRLANLFVSILLIGMAIRITPIFRQGFLLIGLLPMTVFQMASLSPDAATNGLALLFTALVLALAFDDRRCLTPPRVGLLALLAALVAASKSAYFPLAFLIFLVPAGKARSRRAYLVAALLVIAAGLASFALWTRISSEVFVPFYRGGYPSFDAAFQFILDHPLLFVRKLAGNLYYYGFFYVHSFVGILGWLDTPLPLAWVAIEVLALAALAVFDGPWLKLTRWQWVIVFGVLTASVVMVITSQFVLWTRMAAGSINRAQGRYFIPVAPLAFLLLRNLWPRSLRARWQPPERALAWTARVLPPCGLVLALVWVILRYYVAER